MKLPLIITQMFHKTKEVHEAFLSLVLTDTVVSSVSWSVAESGTIRVEGDAESPVAKDTWEARIEAADTAISNIETTVGDNTILKKVVLGFPSTYLTDSGDIDSSIRPHIKKLTTLLELAPLGYVSLQAALVHHLKQDEGVPPSIILIEVLAESFHVIVYRVGTIAGEKTIPRSEYPAEDIQRALKAFEVVEVLPSRMLIYGASTDFLEKTREALLSYQWPSHAHFLHFPKIDIADPHLTAKACAYAGASELMKEVQPSEPEDAGKSESVMAQPYISESSPVSLVNAEAVGFQKEQDILEETPVPRHKLPVINTNVFLKLKKIMSAFRVSHMALMGIVIIVLTTGVMGLAYYLLPQAQVTIAVIPKIIDNEQVITINPKAEAVNEEKLIIPAKKLETTVNGEKIIATTGKKNVGDSAKGTVTIFNKSDSKILLKKGTVIITAGLLQFTLDADVDVASASVSGTWGVQTTTFGQAKTLVTAAAIGSDSNLPKDTEFTIKNILSSTAVARNADAFSGGTSREATVVSRNDYDSLIKSLTSDLVEKAKTGFTGSLTNKDHLIEGTVNTTVVNKSFTEELDQEAKNLHGKLTVAMTGLTYNDGDIETLLLAKATDQIPGGYTMQTDKTTTTVSELKTAKDGMMTVKAVIHLVAVPAIDTKKIQEEAVGTTLAEFENRLRAINGVGSVEMVFRFSLTRQRLPVNKNNIYITVISFE